jgi:hypothetical protein
VNLFRAPVIGGGPMTTVVCAARDRTVPPVPVVFGAEIRLAEVVQ